MGRGGMHGAARALPPPPPPRRPGAAPAPTPPPPVPPRPRLRRGGAGAPGGAGRRPAARPARERGAAPGGRQGHSPWPPTAKHRDGVRVDNHGAASYGGRPPTRQIIQPSRNVMTQHLLEEGVPHEGRRRARDREELRGPSRRAGGGRC
jgi:hypothetical protein